MLSPTFKFLCLGGLSVSLFLGNSVAFAQVGNSSGGVVVPTQPGNGTTTTTTGTGTNTTTTTTRTTTGTGTNTSTTRTVTGSSTNVTSGTRFSCQYYNGQYTVMYQPQSRPNQYFPWAIPRTLGGGWGTQKRCQTIAQRLESYRPDGLVDLKTGTENGMNTLCVTTESNPSCRIVLTVPPEKDPNTVRDSVFQNLTTADNGQQTTGVNTFADNGNGNNGGINQIYNLGRSIFNGGKQSVSSSKDAINLKPFLDRADGGTEAKLSNGVALHHSSQPQRSYRLNTNQLR
jgi:hypothetical protein